MNLCPLCGNASHKGEIQGPDDRAFFFCPRCFLIFVPAEQHVDTAEEKARYLMHINAIEDSGYVSFLERAFRPALTLAFHGARILDYGCGPSPVLGELFEREGYACDLYDPYFFPDMPSGVYDLITATECAEHFRNPAEEFGRLAGLLKPGAFLVLLTSRWQDAAALENWHYARDKTHVCFYHEHTLAYLCNAFGFVRVDERNDDKLAVLRRI